MTEIPKIKIDTLLTMLTIVGIVCIIASMFVGIVPFIIGIILTAIGMYNGLMQLFNPKERQITKPIYEKDRWGDDTNKILRTETKTESQPTLIPLIIAVVAVVALIFVAMGGIVTVGAGNTAVVTNSPEGGLYGETLNEGWHFNPVYRLSNVETIRYNTQIADFVGNDNSDDINGSIMVLSSDNLQIFMDFSITFHIPMDKVWDIRSTYGSDWYNVIINQTARSVPRTECANYTALDIIGSDRTVIEQNIAQKVTDAIQKSGIVVDSMQIKEIRLPASLSDAIEAKLVANQQLEQSSILLQKSQIDAQSIQTLRKSFSSDQAYIAYLQALALTSPDSNVSYVYLPVGVTPVVPVST